MLFEDFDRKIKEAAEQHHPAYDEKAWQKMEKLLDQHLPQEKNDKRRIFLLLLVFLLIGGGAYVLVSKPWSKSSSPELARENTTEAPVSALKESNNATIAIPNAGTNKGSNSDIDKEGVQDNGKQTIPKTSETMEGTPNVNSKLLTTNNSQNIIAKKSRLNKNRDEAGQVNDISATRRSPDQNVSGVEKNDKGDQEIASATTPSQQTPSPLERVGKAVENKKDSDAIAETELKTNKDGQITKVETKKTAQQRKVLNSRNGFSFSVSAGPDVSKAGSSKTGRTTLVYGAAVGYTRNRITLRTGIYAAKKIYWAGSNDYKLKYIPPAPTKFEGADANCNVIEIPVKLSYAFDVRANSNWFAGTGLSSYLMAKEKYIYEYKSASTTNYYPYEARNENKHYFSVLTLSGGYTRQINNTISLTAEPYLEIPLTGIGVGRVHLNSGGMLFSIGIKPFKK